VTILTFDEALRLRENQMCAPLSRQFLAGNEINCTSVEEARQRLVSFDAVGVTDCMARYWTVLGQLLGWPLFADGEVLATGMRQQNNEFYKPAEPNREFRAFAEFSADSELGPEASAAFERAARCDAALYADAMRMAGVLAPRSNPDLPDPMWVAQTRPECGKSPTWSL
jgi:hypothetical protein